MPYKVFLKAPTAATLKDTGRKKSFFWQTAASQDHGQRSCLNKSLAAALSRDSGSRGDQECAQAEDLQEWILHPATLGAASQRISEMYRNVIFAEDDDEEEPWEGQEETVEDGSGFDESRIGCVTQTPLSMKIIDWSKEQETLVSWPSTSLERTRSRVSSSRAPTQSQLETQDVSEDSSYAHTSSSSINAFPTFIINLHTLVPLSDLAAPARETKWTRKVNLLVAVLEVDGPDSVRIKRGPDAGKEVGVLKMVIGGEEGGICKLTAWREVADLWGGVGDSDIEENVTDDDGVRRGDIVFLENILASSSCGTATDSRRHSVHSSVALTASPNLASRLHVCYRTLPTAPSDRRFRPDLRLAASDPGLRKVVSVVRWLQSMTGLVTS